MKLNKLSSKKALNRVLSSKPKTAGKGKAVSKKAAAPKHETAKVTRMDCVNMIRESGKNPCTWYDNVGMRKSIYDRTFNDTRDYDVPKSAKVQYMAVKGEKYISIFKVQVHNCFVRIFETLYFDKEISPGKKTLDTHAVGNLVYLKEEYGANNVMIGDIQAVKKYVQKANMHVHPKLGKALIG